MRWSCRFSAYPKRSIALLPTLARWWSPPSAMEWEEGDVIPQLCVRSTLLEVRKFRCVTRSFEGIVWPVGLSG